MALAGPHLTAHLPVRTPNSLSDHQHCPCSLDIPSHRPCVPLSAKKQVVVDAHNSVRGGPDGSARICNYSASTASTRLTLSLALPHNAWQSRGTSPCRVVARASTRCFRSAVAPRLAVCHRQRVRIQVP